MKRIRCLCVVLLASLLLWPGCKSRTPKPPPDTKPTDQPEKIAKPESPEPQPTPKTLARVQFFGTKIPADHVVYCFDATGSMIDTFDFIRCEMIRSLARLEYKQTFHVMLWDAGNPMEMPPKKLLWASKDHKKNAARFMGTIAVSGPSNPVPALKRAFEVLAEKKTGAKAIIFLTDGNLPDNEAAYEIIRKHNADQRVRIFTFLYGTRPPEAVEAMKKIAKMTGGEYRFVAYKE